MAYTVAIRMAGDFQSIRAPKSIALRYQLGIETRGVHPIFCFKRLKDAVKFARPINWRPYPPGVIVILRCKTDGLRKANFDRIPSLTPLDEEDRMNSSRLEVKNFWRDFILTGCSWPLPIGTMIADAIRPTKVVRECN